MEKPTENSPTLAYVLLALVLFPFILVLVPMFAAAWDYFRPVLDQVGFPDSP